MINESKVISETIWWWKKQITKLIEEDDWQESVPRLDKLNITEQEEEQMGRKIDKIKVKAIEEINKVLNEYWGK